MNVSRGSCLVAAVALTAVTAREAPRPAVPEPRAQGTPIEFRHGAETNVSPGDTGASLDLATYVGGYFEARPRAYAGTYLVPETGDLVVLVTGDLERHRRALDALRREGDPRVVVRRVAYAYDDLVRVVDAVMDRSDELHARGVEVTGGGPDEIANRARIMLLKDTPAARRAVLATLPARDRAMVAFEEGHYATAL